jgi:hypothetical protein
MARVPRAAGMSSRESAGECAWLVHPNEVLTCMKAWAADEKRKLPGAGDEQCLARGYLDPRGDYDLYARQAQRVGGAARGPNGTLRVVAGSRVVKSARSPAVALLRQLHLTRQFGKSRITPKVLECRIRLYQHDL